MQCTKGGTKPCNERDSGVPRLQWCCACEGNKCSHEECRKSWPRKKASTSDVLTNALSKATPGPWVQWVDHAEVFAGPVTRNDRGGINGFRQRICSLDSDDYLENYEHDYDEDSGDGHARRDAALIVAAVNALPSLLLVVKAAREHQCVPTGEIQNEGGDRSCGICDALASLDA